QEPEAATRRQRPPADRAPQHAFRHALLAASLQAHCANVTCLDFSSNGKYLASCARDHTVRIWSTKDFLDRDHRRLCADVERDHATLVRFSPDSRAFIAWLANGETVRVFRIGKQDDGSFVFEASPNDFPRQPKENIVNIGVAETGNFIMTAFSDTTILIWDLKGEVLATINTNQVALSYASISPCGRFVASCGLTRDVKVWEVCFGESGEFREVVRAFDLKGHSTNVYAFAFSEDSCRMVTVSKDGTWKLWDTNVEYRQHQEPYLLRTAECQVSEGCRIALSPDARVMAVSSGHSVAMFSTDSGELEEEFYDVHSEVVRDLRFDLSSRYLVCSGDHIVRVFHNAPGYRAVIRDMEAMLKKASTEDMHQRLRQQIRDAQSALENLSAQEPHYPVEGGVQCQWVEPVRRMTVRRTNERVLLRALRRQHQ
ncbi:hypothetical protein Z043_109906, partial [Scleropages formosus]